MNAQDEAFSSLHFGIPRSQKHKPTTTQWFAFKPHSVSHYGGSAFFRDKSRKLHYNDV